MNNPEYILTEEMGTIANAVKIAMNIPILNYQYGFIEELNETLQQYEADPAKFQTKFPLIWLAEPFTQKRVNANYFSKVEDLNIFIITNTDKNYKASQRMELVYKPVLYPIYRELLKQIALSPVFTESVDQQIPHYVTKGYYWGEAQKSVLNDTVDCLKLSNMKLTIENNPNCTTFSNL